MENNIHAACAIETSRAAFSNKIDKDKTVVVDDGVVQLHGAGWIAVEWMGAYTDGHKKIVSVDDKLGGKVLLDDETAFENRRLDFGSGSLVDGRKIGLPHHCILSNYHVIPTEADAQQSKAVFEKKSTRPEEWIEVRLDPTAGFVALKQDPLVGPLDYCFVAVLADDVPKLTKCEPIKLYKAESKPQAGRPITIWQHPEGGAKQSSQWSIHKVTDEGAIEYVNDTLPGSSGSPIFDNLGQLIGIHARGEEKSNGGCLLGSIMDSVSQVSQAHAHACASLSSLSSSLLLLLWSSSSSWPS